VRESEGGKRNQSQLSFACGVSKLSRRAFAEPSLTGSYVAALSAQYLFVVVNRSTAVLREVCNGAWG
jgi:hypothetical protein